VRDKVTGAVFKTTKGAPHVILKLVRNFAVIAQVQIRSYPQLVFVYCEPM
jgi:hypothetical protein